MPLTVDDARRQVRCLRSGDENLAAEIAAKTARAAAGLTAQPGEELATR